MHRGARIQVGILDVRRLATDISRFLTFSTLCVGLAYPAWAQSAQQALSAPPAEKFAIAPGGVDMRTGTYASQATDLSAGPGDGDAGLKLTRILGYFVRGHNNPFGNFSSNWDIMITQKRIDITHGTTADNSGTDYQVSVRYGGRSQTFRAPSSGGFTVASMAGYAQLTSVGDRNSGAAIYTYTASDGTRVDFRAPSGHDCSAQVLCAYASSVILADGTAFTLNYESPGSNSTRLKSVVSNRGYALLFENAGTVSKACSLNLALAPLPASGTCPASALETSYYSYAEVSGTRLDTVTDAGGQAWKFAYTGGNPSMTMGFIKPGYTTPWLTNSIQYGMDIDTVPIEVVYRQVFADGHTYDYLFGYSPQSKPDEPPVIAGGYYSDNTGSSGVVAYDFPVMPGSGLRTTCSSMRCPPYNVPEDGSDPNQYQQTPDPAVVTDGLGNSTVNDFCDPQAAAGYPTSYHNRCLVTLIQSSTDPEGGLTKFTWDYANRNVLSVRRFPKPGTTGPLFLLTEASYDCTYRPACAKPIAVTDPKGTVTNYTYAPEHGGMLSELLPGPAAGAARPLKLYSYAQRYAWVKDASGALAQATTSVWMPTGVTQCQTAAGSSALSCDASAQQLITTNEYGAAGTAQALLVKGIAVTSGGVTLRTCFTYDANGRKVSETKPNALMGSCP